MQWFNFCFPIGWDELSAIATTVAVFIALMANYNSNKQLKKALQMHEQTKSISLFEMRTQLLQKIIDNEKISIMQLKMLFNDDILDAFKNYFISHNQLKESLNDDYNFWFFFHESNRLNPQKDELERWLKNTGAEILEYEKKGIFCENLKHKFRETCDSNISKIPPDVGLAKDELNYYDIFESVAKAKVIETENKSKLIKKMEQFISTSIQTIS